MAQRLRCPDPLCGRPLTPFFVTAKNLRDGVFHRDFDHFFQRQAWACYPCRANLFLLKEEVRAAGVTPEEAAEILQMDLWGWYLNKAGHDELKERYAAKK